MKKRYYNLSLLLNWLFIVITILLLVRFNAFEELWGNNHQDGKTKRIKKNVAQSYMFSNMKDIFLKVEGAQNLFELPSPILYGKISVEETMLSRRSRRDFKNIPLNAKEVSQLLWAAYGITKPINNPDYLMGGLKTAPSAGARYPLEIYIVVGNVKDLANGVYKYIPKGHKIIKVMDGDKRKELCEAAWYQEMVAEAPVTIVYTAVFSRCTIKYGQRGRDRYVCMDLGHSAQNVYLQCEAIGLGTCAIGAFEDKDVTQVLKFPKEEEVLYLMPVGHYK